MTLKELKELIAKKAKFTRHEYDYQEKTAYLIDVTIEGTRYRYAIDDADIQTLLIRIAAKGIRKDLTGK